MSNYRAGYLLFALFLLLNVFIHAAPAAGAPTAPETPEAPQAAFDVTSTADLPDLNPGNGACQASNGQCTLRAAIEETNALPGMDIINLPDGTYLLDDQLVIQDSLFFNGQSRPNTILDGQLDTPILKIETLELLVCDSGNNSIASYDLNGQRNVDFLGAGAGGMDIPGAVAVGDDDDVFVTAFSSGVHRFSADGANLGLFVDPADYLPAVFAPTDGIFGDYVDAPNGDLYVADFFPGARVLRFDRFSGNQVDVINGGGLAQPNSLAFYDDDLYVTDVGTDRVLRYDAETGNFIEVFIDTFPGGGSPALDRPRGLAFHNGSLFIANENSNSVLKFSAASGNFQSVFVPSGSGGLDKPSDLVFGPDGHLYIISRGNKSILRYDGSSGAFIDTFVAGGDVFLNNPSCLFWREGNGEGPIVNMSNMTLRNGRSPVGGDAAGMHIQAGSSVSFTMGRIEGNESSTFGGGIQNWGNLSLNRVFVVNNSLPPGGGGVTSQGGGIFNAGNLQLVRAAVNNNFATRGGGISNVNDGRVEITDSTISGNTAYGAGGGIRNVVEGRLFINHSTIVNNSINGPGSGDEPDRLGAGIYNSSTARVDIGDSILANNDDNRTKFDNDYSPDCYSETNFHFTSRGGNVIGIINGDCNFSGAGGDQTGSNDNPLDPGLAPLVGQDHQPLPGSPAIDTGAIATDDPFFFTFGCRTVDQIGSPRPVDGDINGSAKCDAGAIEYLPPDDMDGILGSEEEAAPNGGDGNGDGIPDRYQAAVASFKNGADGRYLTLEAPDGTVLQDVQALANSTQAATPPGLFFPFGRLAFSVNFVPAGGMASVALFLPGEVDTYYKYGPTPGDTNDHWYDFAYDGSSGARIAGDRVTMVFVDGARGDSDLSANRRVVDPGAPATLMDEQVFLPAVNGP